MDLLYLNILDLLKFNHKDSGWKNFNIWNPHIFYLIANYKKVKFSVSLGKNIIDVGLLDKWREI
jgi:hypothetical protein